MTAWKRLIKNLPSNESINHGQIHIGSYKQLVLVNTDHVHLEGVPNKGTVGLVAYRKEIQARRGENAVLSWGKRPESADK